MQIGCGLKQLAKAPKEVGDSASLLYKLEAIKVSFEDLDRVMEVLSLQKRPQLQEKKIAIVRICMRVKKAII